MEDGLVAASIGNPNETNHLRTVGRFGRARNVVIAVGGSRVRVTSDRLSDRVRCDHPAVDDGAALGRGLTAAAELLGRGRVVVVGAQQLQAGLEQVGYETEAVMPGFYEGTGDCVVAGKALAEDRLCPRDERKLLEVARVLDEKGEERPPPDDVHSRLVGPADVPQIAALLNQTFARYPTPSNEPVYVQRQLENDTAFRCIEEDGEILACASADLVCEARTAELTDCATRPEHRGRGLMSRLLSDLMDDLRALEYPTAFTLARAAIPGVNVCFSRLGFELRGTMHQSCFIGTGLEDMNVWSRAL